MDSHDFQATGGGTIGFDQKLNLAVNLNLSQELSQKIARSSPAAKLAMKEGRVSLPLVITGSSTGAIVWVRHEEPYRKSSGAGAKESEGND